MKKNMMKMALVALVAFVMPTTMNAQLGGLLKNVLGGSKDEKTTTEQTTTTTTTSSGNAITNILTGITGSSSTASAVTNIVGNLLGTSKVSEASLEGTWVYSEPCVAFESDDVLSKLGGSVASTKVEEKLNSALTKAGIKAGKLTITFNSDKTFVLMLGKKKVNGTYEVNGADLLLTFKMPAKTIKTNVKLSLGTLQIAMNADKLLEIVNFIATKASAYSSQMATVSSLLGNYKGMYLGLKFNK